MAQSKRDKAVPPEPPEVPTVPVSPTEEKPATAPTPVPAEETPDPARREALVELQQLLPLPADFIRIDGKTYDLVNRDAMGLKARLQFKRLAERLEQLERLEPDGIRPEEEAEYIDRLREIVRFLLPSLPGKVLAKLQPGQLSDVYLAFLGSQFQKGKVNPLLMLMRRAGGV